MNHDSTDALTLARKAIARVVAEIDLPHPVDGYHWPPSNVAGFPIAFTVVESTEETNSAGTEIEAEISLVIFGTDATSEFTHEMFNRLQTTHSVRRAIRKDRTLQGSVKDVSVGRKVNFLGLVRHGTTDGLAYEWKLTATIETK